MEHPYHLRYSSPADIWNNAAPLGNGRLGAMVYGRTDIERIVLNDDSLWYGKFADRNNPSLKTALPEIRRTLLAGDVRKAEELILQHMVGAPTMMRHYTFLGQLDLALNQFLPFAMGGRKFDAEPDKYTSDLDLITGVLTIEHEQGGVGYKREMFISHPAQVMCLRLTADKPGAINLDIKLNRVTVSDATVQDERRPGTRAGGGGWLAPNADYIRAYDDKTFMMRGHDSEVEFVTAVRVVCDGELKNPVSQLHARGCTEVVLYLASSTSNRADNPTAAVLANLDRAEKQGFTNLRTEHVADFSALMRRCQLDLGPAPRQDTDKRLEELKEGADDPALAALYFQFGRYLLVSGGREGSSALNLQGIWNAEFMPMWDSKYTININLQMNYWPVEVGNLAELHMPIMDLLEAMHEKGKVTASTMYGMRGMVSHHNTDYYGDSAPQDSYLASTPWITGSAWLGLHVWEHYLYTRDRTILERMYPVLKDMCLFYEDFLMEVDGKLVTCPSVSPENRLILSDGYDTPVCVGPAMDNQILREFFAACIEIQKILDIDRDHGQILAAMIERLPADQIGSNGQLLEWDKEYPELTPDMGHVSHLFACYPGSSINWRDTPDLMRAVNRSLELRVENGAGRGGWPLAWYLNLNARLLDGAKTDTNIKDMLANSAMRNFFNARRVFQIDGNLGVTAGIAECLLQSHLALHFLPALPKSWKNGSVKGLKARGGYEVDINWQDGKLVKAIVKAGDSGQVEVVGHSLDVICEGAGVPVEKTGIGLAFAAEKGKSYELIPAR